MRKTLLIVVLLLTNIVIAQNSNLTNTTLNENDTSTKNISFGLKAGINFNQFNRAGTDYGFQLGGIILFDTGKFYSFSSSLSYNQIGGQEIDRSISSINGSAVIQRDLLNRGIRMHSLDIPLMIHFKHPKSFNKTIRPDFYLGITYNPVLYVNERRDELWYAASTTPTGENIRTLLNNQNENVTSSYKSHLFSTIIGSNIYIKISDKENYFFGFEYRIGIQNIKKTAYPYGGNMKTNQFNLKIGYLF